MRRVCVNDTTATGQTLLFLSLSLYLLKRERERVYFYSRSNETTFIFLPTFSRNKFVKKQKREKSPSLFKNHTSLFVSNTPPFFFFFRRVIQKFVNSFPSSKKKIFKVSSSPESSGLAWCATKLFFCLLVRSERERERTRERENVGKFVEKRDSH